MDHHETGRSVTTIGQSKRLDLTALTSQTSSPSESDEVDAGERVVDLLHRAACCQVAEVDGSEARVLEQRDDFRFRSGVVAGDEDHALAAGFVWIRAEHVGAKRVGGFD